MENQNNNHNQNSNGFLLGLLIGGVATLIFTTKKGRELARELTELGIEKISDLQEKIDEAVVEYEDIPGEDYVEPAERPSEPPVLEKPKLLAKEAAPPISAAKSEKLSTGKAENTQASKPHRAVRRFFRKKN